MICKNCGKENAEGVKFCMSCGQPMSEEAPAAETGVQDQPINNQSVGQPGVNGMPGGIPAGQPVAHGGVPGQMPGGMPGGMPAGQPMGQPGVNGMPGAPMGQPMMPNGMPGSRPMQAGPMYQMPTMQAVPPAQPKKKGGSGVKVLIIIIVVLLLVCVGVLAALGISKRAKQNKFDNLLETAEECIEDGDYEEAVDYYLQALEIYEDDKDAINGLTSAYVDWAHDLAEDGDYEGALEILESADSQAAKKKISAAIEEIEAAMAVSGYDWTDADFVMQGADVTVENGGMIFVENGWTGYMNTITYYTEEFEEALVTARGLEVGMTLADYQSLYPVESGYAIWEENYNDYGYTTYMENYTGQSARDMYADGANDVWLDLGWYKEGGTWQIMTAAEVQDTWFCDAPLRDYDEIVILSVELNSNDKIQCIYIYHVPYDEVWVEYQDWAD